MNNRGFIPLSVPNIKGRELEYVTDAIKTGWVSSGGPHVNQFEEKIAYYVKAKGAVSCQNGTAGIHLALKVCGVSPNDEVLVPTLTFIATVNPVKYVGAEPVFMDCDDNLTMDPHKLLEFCETQCVFVNDKLINKKTRKHIKAIIIVHVFGNMADMEEIVKIADRFNLRVIEDATEALGTYYTRGRYVGKFAGTIGDVGVFSFNGNKIITTGGGGMVVSDNKELLRKAKYLSTQAKNDELYYVHNEIGYNYRLTNLQAAFGLAQLEQLESFIKQKEINYHLYCKGLASVSGLTVLTYRDSTRPNYWFYGLYVNEPYPLNRDQVIKYLLSRGVQSRPIWGLISDQKPYRNNQTYRIVKAKVYLEHVINIPCSSNLSTEDVKYVVDCLKHPPKP